ncbi:MAG: DNA/RNA nuclease SfsA [bacterium]|nr:DNA/RNA nuclease SfsA [bacterium]
MATKFFLPYPSEVIEATLIKRFKRFFAEVVLDDGTQTHAFCPNTGRITSSIFEGGRVRLLPTPSAKIPFRWVQSLTPYGWSGIDTMTPNRFFRKLFSEFTVQGWGKASLVKPEATFGNSRFDYYLEYPGGVKRFVEVKSATYCLDSTDPAFTSYSSSHSPSPNPHRPFLVFPDSPSERAQKHINRLHELQREGFICSVLYAVQHPGGEFITAAKHIDMAYAIAVSAARLAGVEFRAFRLGAEPDGIRWENEEIPVL